jgi:hypothetical protein
MRLVSPTSTRICVLLTVLSCAFVLWSDYRRAARVTYVSGLAQPAQTGAASIGGFRLERKLIVPERAEPVYQALAQTEQMLTRREARVRRVDYDDAPFGRKVYTTSPHRWWLGLIATVSQAATGQPLAGSVENAALVADPLLHLAVLLGLVVFAAWRFGPLAASVLGVGLATMYPLAAGFLPGVPDQHGLSRLLALAAALCVLAGLRRSASASRWLALAGVLGGFGMWVDVSTQVPFVLGSAAGAVLVAWLQRSKQDQNAGDSEAETGSDPLVWRVWSGAGAATVLAAYLVEYAPAHLGSWHLETVHPLYGVAWIGLGELIARTGAVMRWGSRGWGWGRAIAALLALGAVASVPLAMKLLDNRAFLTTDLLSMRLTSEPGGLAAENLWDLLIHATDHLQLTAMLLPVLAVVPAIALLAARATGLKARSGIAFSVGLLVITAAFACREVALFSAFDVSLLALAVAVAIPWHGAGHDEGGAVLTLPRRVLAFGVLALVAIPGLLHLPQRFAGDKTVLTRMEVEELVERDLAQWLARHTREPRPVVFAPPHVSTTLCYYGDLRGLGSFDPDNRAGFGAALTIAAAMTMEEVQAAVEVRGIRYVILPSWDPFFDEFARRYLVKNLSNRASVLATELRRWNLPLWLAPMAYQMPAIQGFENESVSVFEVVEEQKPAVAAGRLVEYLLEMGRVDAAVAMADGLRRYPGDVGALAARAQAQHARDDTAGFARSVEEMRTRIAGGGARYLPFDRRLSVATVLAQANQAELAGRQVRQCVEDLDEKKLRSLSDGGLYRLLVMCQAFEVKLPDPLRAVAMDLLPAALRKEL